VAAAAVTSVLATPASAVSTDSQKSAIRHPATVTFQWFSHRSISSISDATQKR
jgi:hypothetical protein